VRENERVYVREKERREGTKERERERECVCVLEKERREGTR